MAFHRVRGLCDLTLTKTMTPFGLSLHTKPQVGIPLTRLFLRCWGRKGRTHILWWCGAPFPPRSGMVPIVSFLRLKVVHLINTPNFFLYAPSLYLTTTIELRWGGNSNDPTHHHQRHDNPLKTMDGLWGLSVPDRVNPRPLPFGIGQHSHGRMA